MQEYVVEGSGFQWTRSSGMCSGSGRSNRRDGSECSRRSEKRWQLVLRGEWHSILFECLHMRRGGRRWRTKTVAVGTGERIVWTAAAWTGNSVSSPMCSSLPIITFSSLSTLISIIQTIKYYRRQHGYGSGCPRSTPTDCEHPSILVLTVCIIYHGRVNVDRWSTSVRPSLKCNSSKVVLWVHSRSTRKWNWRADEKEREWRHRINSLF